MKVLVTGAAGFIGSHIGNYFKTLGDTVVGWDQLPERSAKENNGWPLFQIDLADQEILQEKLKEEKPDIIIHCAGSADVGKSVANPYSDYDGNVTLTHNLLFAMHQVQLKQCRMVFLSSAAVYGNPKQLPIKETAELEPLSPYALHKVMCESVCEYMHQNYDMDVKILRIFSAYGEGLKKQIFWDMHKKVQRTGRLDMFGTGNESRDYINIRDLVHAVYLVAVKAPKEELIYNIANGEEITIRKATEEFAGAICLDCKKISFSGVEREGNPLNWRADISKLKALGYAKKISFAEGISKYAEWVEKEE